MSHTIKTFLIGIGVFLLSPMLMSYRYTDPEKNLDCSYSGSVAFCAAMDVKAQRTGYEVTIPLLAFTVNKDTLNFFSSTPTTKVYIITPTASLALPLVLSLAVVFLYNKRHNIKIDKKASKKRPMNIWKM